MYHVSTKEQYENYLRELYAWILERYNQFKNGSITKEQYDKDLEHYNKEVENVSRLLMSELGNAEDAQNVVQRATSTLNDVETKAGVSRTNSIAGLRAKMLQELEALRKG